MLTSIYNIKGLKGSCIKAVYSCHNDIYILTEDYRLLWIVVGLGYENEPEWNTCTDISSVSPYVLYSLGILTEEEYRNAEQKAIEQVANERLSNQRREYLRLKAMFEKESENDHN